MYNKAVNAVRSFNCFLEEQAKKNKSLTYAELINAFYQRLRGDYVIPKHMKIDAFHITIENNMLQHIYIRNSRDISSNESNELQALIGEAIELVSMEPLIIPKDTRSQFGFIDIIDSIKKFKVC